MSRIIQMGVGAASECLQEAGTAIPDAIITGTAYGCLQDTGVFLTKMVEHNEELLTPTAFIQSTHNTIGAQIALMLHCYQYNNAFVHRGFSFESALLDGMMLLMENADLHVLVGAVDEITDHSHSILTRMGLYKQRPVSNMDLYISGSKGTIAGEGACFFLLTDKPHAHNYAKLDALTTFYKPDGIKEIERNIQTFLSDNSIGINNIDTIITGKNGDAKNDKIYDQLQETVFKGSRLINYKNLCGEYPTSSAFALWLAANIIKTGTVPAILRRDKNEKPVKKILIYNHYQNIHHSLQLISAC